MMGIEPATCSLRKSCSTTELHRQDHYYGIQGGSAQLEAIVIVGRIVT